MSDQQDLFGGQLPTDPMMDPVQGLTVKVADACTCGSHILTVGPGKGPHKASLRCTDCNRHRGWMSLATWSFLNELCRNGLRPTEPIEVRRGPSPSIPAAEV